MKKSLVILISVVISLSLPLSIYAITPDDSTTYTVDNLEKYDYIKVLLSDMGMDNYFIERLNESQLERYHNAIVRSKNEKLSVSSLTLKGANPKYDASPMALPPLLEPIIKDPEDDYPIYTSTYGDQWMTMFLAVTYMGNGLYHYSIDASWSQRPGNLYTDSLGILAQESRVDYYTAYAWHEGKYIGTNGNTSYSTFEYDYDPNSSHFKLGENGSWSGLAYIFDLPDLLKHTSNFSGYLETINVHFEYEARVSNLSGTIPFSVSSNYDHTVEDIDVDTTFGVSLSTSPSIGFNIDVSIGTDIHRRTCMLQEQLIYYPD